MLLFSALLLAAAVEIHKPTRIPLHFEPNLGQVAGETEWIATAPGGTLFITGQAVAFATADPGTKPRIMRFVGARKAVKGEGEGLTGGYSNYFHGRDEKNWRSGIPHYTRVRYRGLYPGIDLIYYSTPAGQIEYDLDVAPGANPSHIELSFDGFDKVESDTKGDLLLWTGNRPIRQHRPKVLQRGKQIECRYVMSQASRVRLDLAEYDETAPLTVDPVLDFSTYLGGPGTDFLGAVTVDRNGFIYVAGNTQTPATPALNPFQQANIVAASPFVAKFTTDGQRIVLFSVVGTAGGARSVLVDEGGNILLTGTTSSPDFPLRNAFQREYKSFVYEGFVAKLSPDGRTLVYSSYFGGSGYNNLFRSVPDGEGGQIFAGNTSSGDMPVKNAVRPSKGGNFDCFLARVSRTGSLVYSTYVGGSETDYCYSALAVDSKGRIYIGGETYSDDLALQDAIQTVRSPRNGFPTAFLTRFTPDGQKIDYSTFIGGAGSGGLRGIGLNAAGEIYLGITAYGGQFQTANAYQNTCEPDICAAIMRLDASGQKVLSSSFLTGSGRSSISALAIAADGSVYFAGTAASADFPSKDSLAPFVSGGSFGQNIFVARFSENLRSLGYSTFLGGAGDEYLGGIAVDGLDRLLVVGGTPASDFQVKNAFQPATGGGSDGFLARISDTGVIAGSPLMATPGQVRLRLVQGSGGAGPAPQDLQLAGEGIAYRATANAAWLTVNPQTGIAPVTLRIGAAVLNPGVYSAEVTVTPATGGAPLVIPVSYSVLLPAPELTLVEPSFVAFGSDDTVVTLRGSGFTRDTQVRLYETVYSSPVTFGDSQTLQFRMSYLSFLAEGSYRFSVVNPQSDVSKAVVLSVGRLSPSITSVVSAASRLSGPVARGGLLVINGLNLGPADRLKATIGNFPALISAVIRKDQVELVVPALVPGASPALVVSSDALVSAPFPIEVAESAPGLFTADDSGIGDALIDGTPSPGSTIALFGTGDGGLPVSVWIDGKEAIVESSGLVESKPGWFQVKVVIPFDASMEGPVPVVVKAGEVESQPGVTLTLRKVEEQ